jgi:hypothetical protein
MTGIQRRDSIPAEGVTPRRRGDSARRVRWPEQGEAEVRPLNPENGGVHECSAKSRKSPPYGQAPVLRCRPPAGPFDPSGPLDKLGTSGLRTADDRRPQGDPSAGKPPRGLLQRLAARSRPLAYLGSTRSHQRKANRIDPPARGSSRATSGNRPAIYGKSFT